MATPSVSNRPPLPVPAPTSGALSSSSATRQQGIRQGAASNGHCRKCGGWLRDRDQDGDPVCVICGLTVVRRAPAPYSRRQVEPHRKVYRRRQWQEALA
jgi:uncharacterized Zn finger protein (UPF0148 family)